MAAVNFGSEGFWKTARAPALPVAAFSLLVLLVHCPEDGTRGGMLCVALREPIALGRKGTVWVTDRNSVAATVAELEKRRLRRQQPCLRS